MNVKIELGMKVRCLVTGFEGIATGRCEYLNGCVQYLVRPRCVAEEGKPAKYPDGTWIDFQNLEVIGDGVLDSVSESDRPGGDDAPSSNYRG